MHLPAKNLPVNIYIYIYIYILRSISIKVRTSHHLRQTGTAQVMPFSDYLVTIADGCSFTATGGHVIPINGKNGVSMASLIAHVIMIPVAKLSGWLAQQHWYANRASSHR